MPSGHRPTLKPGRVPSPPAAPAGASPRPAQVRITDTPDTAAIIAAADRLTTQVRRIADALEPTVVCGAPGPWGDAHTCNRPASRHNYHVAEDGCFWSDATEAAIARVRALAERWRYTSDRKFLEQRQEMAAERYAWQERGDRAEAANEQLRDQLSDAWQKFANVCGQRDRLRLRMEALAERWRLPGHISMPDAAAELLAEISIEPFPSCPTINALDEPKEPE